MERRKHGQNGRRRTKRHGLRVSVFVRSKTKMEFDENNVMMRQSAESTRRQHCLLLEILEEH
jgi:hypothetical protein